MVAGIKILKGSLSVLETKQLACIQCPLMHVFITVQMFHDFLFMFLNISTIAYKEYVILEIAYFYAIDMNATMLAPKST